MHAEQLASHAVRRHVCSHEDEAFLHAKAISLDLTEQLNPTTMRAVGILRVSEAQACIGTRALLRITCLLMEEHAYCL